MWTLFLLFYTLKANTFSVTDITMHSQTITGFSDQKGCELVSSALKAHPPDSHINVYAVCVEVK